jgi:hypothetical protein
MTILTQKKSLRYSTLCFIIISRKLWRFRVVPQTSLRQDRCAQICGWTKWAKQNCCFQYFWKFITSWFLLAVFSHYPTSYCTGDQLLYAAKCPSKKQTRHSTFPANKHEGPICISCNYSSDRSWPNIYYKTILDQGYTPLSSFCSNAKWLLSQDF